MQLQDPWKELKDIGLKVAVHHAKVVSVVSQMYFCD